MHAVTKRVPLPVAPLRLVNRLANGFFRVAAPNGGHIFFISAVRKGTAPASARFATPFRCPRCSADIGFGEGTCGKCGASLPYSAAGYLDSVELNPEVKAELNPK
jgi:hypothetical protein